SLSPCSPLLLFPTSPSLSPCSPILLRCRCKGRLLNGLDPRSITRFEVFPPGSICDKVDIIVTMKSRKQICNGDKPQGPIPVGTHNLGGLGLETGGEDCKVRVIDGCISELGGRLP
uniref:Chemokine interleukin-8-like domain-containing protein n=1 Tax=Leptobrachium leishanense TaxID=445787 RepID=A0A8C5PJ59_9ANUR